MRSDAVKLVLVIIVLCGCGAIEEMLPKFGGVGMPLLLTTVMYFASQKWRMLETLLLAIAAGGIEDALSGLPLMTSVSYYLAVAMTVRCVEMPPMAAMPIFATYQLWLYLWFPGIEGGVFLRLMAALPMAIIAMYSTRLVISWIEKKAAANVKE